MNRPDSNSADQSANRDDEAVWLDLVARLEAMPSASTHEAGTAEDETTSHPSGGSAVPTGNEHTDPGHSSFRDFDPLGLSPASRQDDTVHGPTEATTAADDGGPRDYGTEDDEGFVPEEPPSLEGAEPLTVLAWLGAVGGPVALLLSAMFWRTAPLAAILGIVGVFVASVIYLIMRLPQEKDDNDDGARV